MGANRFDTLTRHLTAPGSRRVTLRALLATLLGGALLEPSRDALTAAAKKKPKTRSRKATARDEATGRWGNRHGRPPHDRQAGQDHARKQRGQREGEPAPEATAPVSGEVADEEVTATSHGCGHTGTACGTDDQCCSGLCSDVNETCCLGSGRRCKRGAQCCSELCKGPKGKKTCRCAANGDCAGGKVCRSGRCVCDTSVGCGDACPCPGGTTCRITGQCGDPCGVDEQECDGVCRNLQTDEANCGSCGTACPEGLTCCSGSCKNLAIHRAHCGSCGNACASGESCCSGVCANLDVAEAHCGSCGNACSAGQTCCSGSCKYLTNDRTNCGTCGNACASGNNCCSGICWNTNSVYHCGYCGNTCASGEACSSGRCCRPLGSSCSSSGSCCSDNCLFGTCRSGSG